MLAWISRHGVVTAEQVRRRFFARDDGTGKRAALRRLQILEELHLIRRDATLFRAAPRVIRITGTGARIGQVTVAPARLVEQDIRHAIALVDLTEHLAAQIPQARLTTERELRQERYRQQSSDRRDRGRRRCPDALLTFPDGGKVAVELELAVKRPVDYERILRAYGSDPEGFSAIWWYVVPGTADRVRDIVRRNNYDDYMKVVPYQGFRDDDRGSPHPSYGHASQVSRRSGLTAWSDEAFS